MKTDIAVLEACQAEINRRHSDALIKADQTKQALYQKRPELQQIDFALAQTGFSVARAILGRADDVVSLVEGLRQRNEELFVRRDAILAEEGMTPEDLEPKFTCSLCKDSGYLEGKKCVCLQELIKNRAVAQLAAQSPLQLCDFEHFDLSYFSDTELAHGRVERERMAALLAAAKQYAADFHPEQSPNLLFHGNTGLGKTHLSLAIAKQVLEKGYGVIYDSCQNMMTRIEREHFNRPDGQVGCFDTLCQCDLLILDDLGSEFGTSFVTGMLYTLINNRLAAHKPTIISTNLEMEELAERYTDRVASRILSEYKLFYFVGKDIRLQKKAAGR